VALVSEVVNRNAKHHRLVRGKRQPLEVGHDEAHDEAHEPISDTERRILDLRSDEPRSTPVLLRSLGYQSRTGNYKRALGRPLDMGYLEMSVPAKPRSKNQKYRITEKGREMLRVSNGES